MLVAETRARCDNLRPIWPGTADLVEPLLAELQATVPHLDSTDPAPIHGDMAAGQFLWTGERLVLLDWDMFGYADPAYDAGHFVAQLERRCTLDRTLPPEGGRWRGTESSVWFATTCTPGRRTAVSCSPSSGWASSTRTTAPRGESPRCCESWPPATVGRAGRWRCRACSATTPRAGCCC